MKRFVIFALLGPPLGMITGLWVMLPLFNLALGARPLFEPSTLDWHKVVLLPFAYLMGLLPTLAAAGFDEKMAKRRWRVLRTALFSFAVAFFPIAGALAMGFMQPFMLLFGFIGAVPGAICSWLAGKTS
jgi:hypothetical protein